MYSSLLATFPFILIARPLDFIFTFASPLVRAFPEQSSCSERVRKRGQEAGKGSDSPSTGRTRKIKFQTPSESISREQYGKDAVVLLELT